MSEKTDQRLKLTLRQLEVFTAIARGGTTRAAADEISRSQSAASNALGELESVLGVRLFDRVGKRLVLNEDGQALLPKAAGVLEQAQETERLFQTEHASTLRLASSYTIGEYLLPDLVATWKDAHPHSPVRLAIANTHDVFEAVASFAADLGFIEGTHTSPDVLVRRWRTDELVIFAAPTHPLAGRRPGLRQLARAAWVLRETGSGTREAADRWLMSHLDQVDVSLELGSNEAVKRAVARGGGLGCLSRLAVQEAVSQGWLVELHTPLAPMSRPLSIATHRHKQPGSAARGFLRHCLGG